MRQKAKPQKKFLFWGVGALAAWRGEACEAPSEA
jgi:hypothetical protein